MAPLALSGATEPLTSQYVNFMHLWRVHDNACRKGLVAFPLPPSLPLQCRHISCAAGVTLVGVTRDHSTNFSSTSHCCSRHRYTSPSSKQGSANSANEMLLAMLCLRQNGPSHLCPHSSCRPFHAQGHGHCSHDAVVPPRWI